MRLLPDGTLVGMWRPSTKEARDPRTGRGKTFSANTVVVANRLRWLVGINETDQGEGHGTTLVNARLV